MKIYKEVDKRADKNSSILYTPAKAPTKKKETLTKEQHT